MQSSEALQVPNQPSEIKVDYTALTSACMAFVESHGITFPNDTSKIFDIINLNIFNKLAMTDDTKNLI